VPVALNTADRQESAGLQKRYWIVFRFPGILRLFHKPKKPGKVKTHLLGMWVILPNPQAEYLRQSIRPS